MTSVKGIMMHEFIPVWFYDCFIPFDNLSLTKQNILRTLKRHCGRKCNVLKVRTLADTNIL